MCVVMSLVLFHASGLLPVILVAYLLRGGFFSAWAVMNATLGVNAPARHRSRGFAIVEMAGGLASSMGPIVGGLLYAVAIVLGVALIPVILVENRRARSWPHESEPVLVENEPVIGESPVIALDLAVQPVLLADPASGSKSGS